MARSQLFRERPRRVLVSALISFAIILAAASYWVEHFLPYARDPEFTTKIRTLQALLQQGPGRPLVLMLGSSRTLLAFQAGQIHGTYQGQPILAFNMGMTASGPFTQLLCLRRMLAAGIHPDLLLVEVFPLLFNHAGQHPLEEVWLQSGRMRFSELVRLENCHSDRLRLIKRWCLARLTPWTGIRSWAEQEVMRMDTRAAGRASNIPAGMMDRFGWKPHFPNGITADMRSHMLQVTYSQYRDCMRQFHPGRPQRQAFDSLLDICRQNQIPVALVIMPEGNDFRSHYAPRLREQLQTLICRMAQDRHVPLHDASDWVPDQDFSDSHHVLPSGAATFTQHLMREAIEPELAMMGGTVMRDQ
jgi:Protein of unknown function (DUF1574)